MVEFFQLLYKNIFKVALKIRLFVGINWKFNLELFKSLNCLIGIINNDN